MPSTEWTLTYTIHTIPVYNDFSHLVGPSHTNPQLTDRVPSPPSSRAHSPSSPPPDAPLIGSDSGAWSPITRRVSLRSQNGALGKKPRWSSNAPPTRQRPGPLSTPAHLWQMKSCAKEQSLEMNTEVINNTNNMNTADSKLINKYIHVRIQLAHQNKHKNNLYKNKS